MQSRKMPKSQCARVAMAIAATSLSCASHLPAQVTGVVPQCNEREDWLSLAREGGEEGRRVCY
jgi:hypothetical protein